MADERGHTKPGGENGPDLSGAAEVIYAWLGDLERSGNRLLGGRCRDEWWQDIGPLDDDKCLAAITNGVTAQCSPHDLDEAIILLEERSLVCFRQGRVGNGGERVIAALGHTLRRLARERTEADQSPEPSSPAVGPEMAWEAAVEIQRAKRSSAVIQAVLEWAARACPDAGLVWWEQAEGDGRLTASRTRGVRLEGKAKTFQPPDGFWSGKAEADQAAVIRLRPEKQEHAAFLSQVGAKEGVVVRAHDGERWVGALSIHQGGISAEVLSFLVGLVQQAASVLRTRALEDRQRHSADEHQQCIADLGHALASALDLKELLGAVCRLAVRTTGADACCLLLADDEGRPMVRASEGVPEFPRLPDTSILSAMAELTSAESGDNLWWRPKAKHAEINEQLHAAGIGSALGLALPVRGQPVGVLILMSESEDAFRRLDREVLSAFAAQSAVAIENLQLFEDMQRRLLEMADLTWVSTHIAATLEVDKIANAVAEGAAKALGAPRAAILLPNEKGDLAPLWAGCVGMEEAEVPPLEDKHVGAKALDSGAPEAVCDAEREGRGEDPLVKWLNAKSLLCAPMTTQQGLRGLLVVGDDRPRRFPTHLRALLAAYANQGALALQSALLYRDVVQHLDDLTKLFELSRKLAASEDLNEALEAVLAHASDILDAPTGLLLLVDRQTRDLVVRAARGFSPDTPLETAIRLKPGEGMAGKAVQSGSVLTSADVSRDGRFRYRDLARSEGLRAGACAPMMSRGEALGALCLYRRKSRQFTEKQKRMLAAIAGTAALAVENAHLSQEVRRQCEFVSALMGKINHLVRNSLESVAGVLRTELRRSRKLSPEGVIKRAIAHVQTMAVVHELGPSRDPELVDARQMTRRVIQVLKQSVLGATRGSVATKVTGAQVRLPSHKASRLAVALGELVDNALRHGLSGGKPDRLTVTFSEVGGDVIVQVSDNGPGLPAKFDLENCTSLGLNIVKGVVETDLRGKLELRSKDGLTVLIRFPKH